MENIAAIFKLFLNLRLLFPVPFLLCFASLLLMSSDVSSQVQEKRDALK
jgi:hypothetical protein